jgi:hypothetical protein
MSYVYAPHADANHAQAAKWYEELMCLVFDTHKLARFVDLIVRIPTRAGGIVQLVEVKTEGGASKPHQDRLALDWGCNCLILVRTQRDVMEHVERVQGRFK